MRASIAAVLSLALAAPAAADGQPNIIFIMTDDHCVQATGAYGSKINTTPNIDRIADGGMRFDACYVTNAICGPARAVILTGLHSHRNGFMRNGNLFDGAQDTFPKHLQRAGYQTAMIGKWHLKSEPTGFDHAEVLIGQGPYYNPPMIRNGERVEHTGYTSDLITDLALEWMLEERDAERPFMMMVHHKAPHRHWQPGPDHIRDFEGADIPEPATLFDDYAGRGTGMSQMQEMSIARHLSENDLKLSPQRGLNEEQLELWNDVYEPKNEAFRAANLEGDDLIRWMYQRYAKDYLRCVASVDDGIGRILDALDEHDLAEDTIVIYTSDQGWYVGEHGWYDKRWMYEESFQTPLIVRWPGVVEPGSTCDALAQNLDFAPTMLAMAGLEAPEAMQGLDLTPLLRGETPAEWRRSVYYHYYEHPGTHNVPKHEGVRTKRYKIMHFYDFEKWEMYDMLLDPDEMTNVYDDPGYAHIREAMEQELIRQKRAYGVESP